MDLDVRLLGERLLQLRELRGQSVSSLAQEAGIAKSYLARLERGDVQNPGLGTINSIAAVLQVSLAQLFAPPTGSHQPARWSTLVDPLVVEHLRAEMPESLRTFLDELQACQGERTPADVFRSLALLQFRGKRPERKEDWWFVYEAVQRSLP